MITPAKTKPFTYLILTLIVAASACQNASLDLRPQTPAGIDPSAATQRPTLSEIVPDGTRKIIENGTEQPKVTKNYTQEYFTISYPNGDVPIETGACTDVVIRALRHANVDLQKEVHEDMAGNFRAYPQKWGLNGTDRNIDHRRVPNLQTYFTRRGKDLPLRGENGDYKPGDIVSWDLNNKGMTHIGLVSNLWNEKTGRYLIIHNIGSGTRIEDRLFEWKITGHYRYF
jgi:uncharacterized protein YijF (DUF1287 family)